MINTVLLNPKGRNAVDIQKNANGVDTLMILTDKSAYGQFKSASRTSAGTTIIVSPNQYGAIVLTDLIFSTDRVAAATLTVQFTDGTNTVIIFSASVADAPIFFAIPFAGRWRGWRDARLEMVTVGTVKATVSVGYFKVSADVALPYIEWNAKR